MLERERATLLVALATLVLTVLLYIWIPKGLFPTQDTGQLQARVEASQSVSYPRMAQLQQEVARRLMEDPDVETLSSFVGVDAANNTMLHTGRMLINLKPGHGNQQQVMDRLRQRAQRRGRHRAVPAADAGPDHRRRDRARRSTGCRSKAPTTRLVAQWATRLVQQLQQRAGSCATWSPTPTPPARRCTSTSTATRRRA